MSGLDTPDLDQGILDIIAGHAVGLTTPPTRATLITDLGIDSFAVVEIIYEIEEKLKIEVPFNANENPLEGKKTVGDLIDVVKKLAGKE
ncbi:MAG: phosphopantetheine-binding protein [Parvularculaceae bacterium]